jgi:hypothetical protein
MEPDHPLVAISPACCGWSRPPRSAGAGWHAPQEPGGGPRLGRMGVTGPRNQRAATAIALAGNRLDQRHLMNDSQVERRL